MPLPSAFRRLAWSNLLAQSSEQIALAAAPLVAVLALGAGAAETGWLQTAQTLPFLVCALPAGILADRSARNRLMAGAEALRAGSLVAVLALLLTGQLSLPLLALLGALGAIGTVAYTVAAPALIPALVPRERLADANRLIELARSLAFAAGPALGGALVGLTGAPVAFGVAVAISVAATILLAGLPDAPRAPVVGRSVRRELAEGAAFAFGHRLLRPIVVTAIVFNTSWFILMAVFVAYAVETLRLDATAVGIVLGCFGAGTVAGALAAPVLLRRFPFGALVGIGPLTALLGALLMAATLRWPSGWLAATAFLLFGVGPVLWVITTTTLRQAVTPGPLLGRVSATIVTASSGARPLGAAIGAGLASHGGAEAALLVSLAGFSLQAVLVFASPLPYLAALPAEGSPDVPATA